MFSDPQFWVAVAFVIFLLAVFKPIKKILSASLDSKILEIKKNIDEAENLKNETQLTLSDIKKRQNEVKSEINNIRDNANKKVKDLESAAKQKLNDQIAKREFLSKAKIEQMTRDANSSIQRIISLTAIEATVNLIEDKLNEQDKQNLIDQSIKDLGSALKN